MLGICLGLQLALEWSDEDGGVEGLGPPARPLRAAAREAAFRAWAGRWSSRSATAFYFAHSYAAATPCATAWAEGAVAEARAPAFIGCQFHPEKSGPAGARYLAGVLEEVACLSPA